MIRSEFEDLLSKICQILTDDVRASTASHKPSVFEDLVRKVTQDVLTSSGRPGAIDAVTQGFPDIVIGKFGIEVKATESDNWRCIANSVSEGNRAKSVEHIYLIYGKLGGTPEVKWADYGQSIVHVRTSHVPRFEVEIGGTKSLFEQIGINYDQFNKLPMEQKMPYIRQYARSRLQEGERLWWLEDKEPDEQEHSLDLAVKIYMDLDSATKRKMRAEAALMCPQVVGGSRQKRKYVDAVVYLMTYRGVLCPQARDLFSAGSVAGKERGGHYITRSFTDIQNEMRAAAYYLEDELFKEYWGFIPRKEVRILEWLRKADRHATEWKPSDHLFLREQGRPENP